MGGGKRGEWGIGGLEGDGENVRMLVGLGGGGRSGAARIARWGGMAFCWGWVFEVLGRERDRGRVVGRAVSGCGIGLIVASCEVGIGKGLGVFYDLCNS